MANENVALDQKVTYFKERLDLLGKSIQNSTSFQTQEAYITECHRVLKRFYEDISEPYFNYEEAVKDLTLIPTIGEQGGPEYAYNVFWMQLLDNLILLFTQMENLEALSIANYNFAMVEMEDLTARLKSVSSKLGDYALYSKNTLRDVLLVRDSFNNLLKIDSGHSSVTSDECEVNQEEGVVTLPQKAEDNKAVSIPSDGVIITSVAGAFAGNNHDIVRTVRNADIDALIDGNPDTWFEYEKVVNKNQEDEPPLVINISLNLGEPKIINHVVVNPNNFGTKTVLNIDSIDTSLDGKVFTSIKDDIPIVGYKVEDEENVFRLAPSTSKFAGQGVYTFTPRKAQFVRMTLRQNEPYIIATSSGEKLRYAIGIRDILLKALAFKSKGELISKPFTVTDEIKKVMLEVAQTPVVDSELTNIKYLISPDDGVSWNQIQPKHLSSLSGIASTVPEIINFNTSDSNSIKTSKVQSIRLKIELEREDENFVEGASSLAKTVATKAEIHSVPIGSPNIITLENPPIQDSNGPKVEVIDALFGSMGLLESVYMLKYASSADESNYPLPKEYRKVEIPFSKDSSGVISYTPYKVYVGGEEWQSVTGPFSQHADEPRFRIDHGESISELVFDSEDVAATPPESSSIGIGFGPQRLFPTADRDSHEATLYFKTSRTKDSMIIERHEASVFNPGEQIPYGAGRFNTPHNNITVESITGYTLGTDKVDFIDGVNEFLTGGKLSVDEKEGVIYFKDPVSSSDITNVVYSAKPVVTLANNDWDWIENSADGKYRLAIKESGWATREDSDSFSEEEEDEGIDQKSFHLSHLGIVGGTLTAEVSFLKKSTNPFASGAEKFIDGVSQFEGVPVDNPKWTYDAVRGIVYVSHPVAASKITFSYQWVNFQAKYTIGRTLKLNTDYAVDIPNRKIAIKDKEFLENMNISHMTRSGRAGYYLVNYDYVSESRESIEELKNHFTPVVKDYVLKILRSVEGTLEINSAPFPNNTGARS